MFIVVILFLLIVAKVTRTISKNKADNDFYKDLSKYG